MKLEWVIRGDSENSEKRVVVCEAYCDFWSKSWSGGSYNQVTSHPIIKLLYHDYKKDVMREVEDQLGKHMARVQTKGRRFTASFPSFARNPDLTYYCRESMKSGLFSTGVPYKEMTLEYAQMKAQQALKESLENLIAQL